MVRNHAEWLNLFIILMEQKMNANRHKHMIINDVVITFIQNVFPYRRELFKKFLQRITLVECIGLSDLLI